MNNGKKNKSEPKRHHYVSRFLLDRFSRPTGEFWRLDLKTGKPTKANPKNEAVIKHYNKLEKEDGSSDLVVEYYLAELEHQVSPIISRLCQKQAITPFNRELLAAYLHITHTRTPLQRKWRKPFEETHASLMAQVDFSDLTRFKRRWEEVNNCKLSDEEAYAKREEILKGLETGEIYFKVDKNRLIVAGFMAFEPLIEILMNQLKWEILTAPEGQYFIISDTPVAQYDPKPRVPEGGVGYLSSPATETTFPIDPSYCIRLLPGSGVRLMEADVRLVDEINLRTYAWAQQAIYGNSQGVVQKVRQAAKQRREIVNRFTPRPSVTWIAENASDVAGVQEFTGHTGDGRTIKRKFYVDPEHAKRWEPS